MSSIRATLVWLLLGALAIGLHLAWWGWARPPQVRQLKSQVGSARLVYLPIPSDKARVLPAIWYPSFPVDSSTEAGELETLAAPPLEYVLDLSTLLPDTELMAPRVTPSDSTPLFERGLRRLEAPLALPVVVAPTADPVGIHLRVEPPEVQDSLRIGTLPRRRRSAWQAELFISMDDGVAQHVLLDVSSKNVELDRKLITWAYGLQSKAAPNGLRVILWEDAP